jgi:hypothetical protein
MHLVYSWSFIDHAHTDIPTPIIFPFFKGIYLLCPTSFYSMNCCLQIFKNVPQVVLIIFPWFSFSASFEAHLALSILWRLCIDPLDWLLSVSLKHLSSHSWEFPLYTCSSNLFPECHSSKSNCFHWYPGVIPRYIQTELTDPTTMVLLLLSFLLLCLPSS